jgi:WD40 repeat protein
MQITQWNINTGICLKKISVPMKDNFSVNYYPEGKILALGSSGGIIRIWDVKTGKSILSLSTDLDYISHASVSSNAKVLAFCGSDSKIKLWDLNSGKYIKSWSAEVDYMGPSRLYFSLDGKILASCGPHKTIKLWDVNTGICNFTLSGRNTEGIFGNSGIGMMVSLSSNGNYIAGNIDCNHNINIWKNDVNVTIENPTPKLPSILEVSQLMFNDSKGNYNKLIDANEQSQISFQLKNTGKGSAYGIVVSLSTEIDVKGIIYQKEYKIDELAPNEEKQIVMPITSDFNTENAKVKFIIKTKEANGFDAPDEIIHVETAKFLNPLVSVADYNFSSEKGGIAKLGEVINLNFAVQNKGQGEAKNVKIVCTLPSSNVFAAGETEFTVPLLKPNESKVINFDFFPNRIYKQNNIPVAIDITESYGKYGESKTCTVALNTELKQQNEIIVQGTKQESIEIKSVSLLSDIDKNLPIANVNNTNAIAVIIGNSNYANTKSVAYAISDAQSMKNYLINVLGFKEGNILFKENATLGDFNTLFGTKENQKGRLANTIKENISDVFVFYAGHGAPGLKDNKGYFVPVECNPNYVENSGYCVGCLFLGG